MNKYQNHILLCNLVTGGTGATESQSRKVGARSKSPKTW